MNPKPAESARHVAGKGTSGSAAPPMIEADGLSKFYGIFTACRDVTFQVHQGELVAFLGPNGAGKSTTMKLLTGYLAPSEGVAKIAGHDMSSDRLAASARRSTTRFPKKAWTRSSRSCANSSELAGNRAGKAGRAGRFCRPAPPAPPALPAPSALCLSAVGRDGAVVYCLSCGPTRVGSSATLDLRGAESGHEQHNENA